MEARYTNRGREDVHMVSELWKAVGAPRITRTQAHYSLMSVSMLAIAVVGFAGRRW